LGWWEWLEIRIAKIGMSGKGLLVIGLQMQEHDRTAMELLTADKDETNVWKCPGILLKMKYTSAEYKNYIL
jgi:hypothetical protein